MTISPVSNEQLLELLKDIEDSGTTIASFNVTDHVATLNLHIRQRNYSATVKKLLEIGKGLTVDLN